MTFLLQKDGEGVERAPDPAAAAPERCAARAGPSAEASARLDELLDEDAILSAALELLVPGVGDLCTFDLIDDSGALRRAATRHVDPDKQHAVRELEARYPPDASRSRAVVEALRSRRPVLQAPIDDAALVGAARDEDHLRLLRTLSPRSSIVVPLHARGRLSGLVRVSRSERDRAFTAEDLDVVSELARRAALALDNARMRREAESAARARDDLLGIASHELKTPLAGLHLRLQMLARRLDRAGQRAHAASLRDLAEQTAAAAHLVDEILGVARLAAGGQGLEAAEMDLAATIEEVSARMRPCLDEAGCALALDLDRPVPGHWDKTRIEQILTNLLSNAAKYGAGAPVEVRLRADRAVARIAVRDGGIGIARADQQRIFDRYERVEPGVSRSSYGLGLWIVRQLAEAHGGRVEVESAPGAGATFLVELPRGRMLG